MKNLRSLHLVFICAMGLISCRHDVPTTSVSVLCDVSETSYADSAQFCKDIPALLQLIVTDTLKPGPEGGRVRLTALNNLSQNSVKSIVLLPGKSGALGVNPYVRHDDLLRFQHSLESGFNQFRQSHRGETDLSKIYMGLCVELNLLATDSADRKILVVYSDFLENSELFSFYSNNRDFLKNPVQFADSVLNKACPLPPLQNIEIYLIAHRTHENDEAVNCALGFWKAVLEHSGATVRTGADLASIY